MLKNKYIGSDFDELLREDGTLEEVEILAIKRVIAFQLTELMKKKHLSKTAMSKAMKTSRASLERLLDPMNGAVTLHTLGRAGLVLGKKLKVEFV